ncbi:MAG: NAD(P)H-dependent glycerol-3-phosphate dehydrogenase, partial [Actinomycetota bacterium]
FMTPIFRTYANPDLIGVELGGVLKNVVAIAVGLAEGLGFQINSRAALMTRGLTEMIRMGTAMGARASTFSGLSGIGDLICTCMSPLSRNHRVGVELGKGREIAGILRGTREVAEGVESSRAVWALAERHDVYMPICRGVYRVIHEGQDANEMAADLLRLVRQRELD